MNRTEKLWWTVALLVGISIAALVAGCASFNARVFHAEQLAATTGKTAVSAYNAWWRTKTNNAPDLARLMAERERVWEGSRRLAASLQVVENMRASYETNGVQKGELLGALAALSGERSNIVWLVTYLKGVPQ